MFSFEIVEIVKPGDRIQALRVSWIQLVHTPTSAASKRAAASLAAVLFCAPAASLAAA
jgi:hypothetical protein